MAKKKSNTVIFIVILIVVIIVAAMVLKNNSSTASVIGLSPSNCETIKFVNQGHSYSDFNALRTGENIQYTDEQLLSSGFLVKSDGVYTSLCR